MISRPIQRTLAWTVSIAVHVVVVSMILWRGNPGQPELPADPDRLVFIEPAPPPPPPRQELASAVGEEPQLPEEQPLDDARLVEPQPTLKPTAKPSAPRQPSPRPTATVPQAVRPPATAEPAPSAVARASGAGGADAGVAGGVAGGAPGGVVGGILGGHGTDVVKAEIAAKPPMLVKRILPEYPLEARTKGIEGQVLLRAIVNKEGRIEDNIEVVRSAPPLDDAAVAALRQWKFTPGRDRDGHAVRVQIDVPMRFQLQ